MRTADYTKPNRPINFLPNSCVRDIKKPIWGLFTPWDQNIWAPPPLFRNQLYGTHTSSNLFLGWDTKSWLECGNFHTSDHPCPSLPTRVGSHEYGNNGESFYQRRPLQLLVVFTQIPTTIRFNLDGFNNDEMFFSHTHKNSSPTLLVCEGDPYGASCPPLLGSEQQRRGDNLYPLPIRGAPRQGPLAPLAQQGGSWVFEQQHILWPSF